MAHSSLGRAGLSSLYEQPKAQTRARITHEVARKNYLANDDSDDDDDNNNGDDEGYQIDPSVQLFKAIDFGRNKGNASSNNHPVDKVSPHKRESAASRAFSTPERSGKSDVRHTLEDGQQATFLSNGKPKGGRSAAEDSLKLEPDEMSKNERDSLIDALEKMRKQNETLVKQVAQTKQESQLLLERERHERTSAVTRMQEENDRLTKTLMLAQQDAEIALSAEKEKLRAALRSMEAEKNELLGKIKTTEDSAREEFFRLQYLQAEQQRKITLLESEKGDLVGKLASNEEHSKRANVANSAALASEREKLLQQLKDMENEKNDTIMSLQRSQQESQAMSETMAKQLESEKDALRISLERMEAEKVSLSASLAAKEKEVAANTKALETQLSKDHKDLSEAISRIESSKELLTLKYQRAKEEEAEERNARVASEIQQARIEMQKQLEQMIAEKEELAQKLMATEEAAAEKLRLDAMKQATEKKELLDAVQKMRADLEQERQQMVSLSDSINSPKSPVKSPNTKSPSPHVNQQKSLFGIMEGDAAMSGRSTGSRGSRFISSIPEDVEGENFMNVDDDDDDAEEHLSPYSSPGKPDPQSGKSAFNDLPAPHEAAALGDLQRLEMLGGLEPSLLQSVDASSRSPLFYAAAYGHTDAAKFLADNAPIMIITPDTHGDTPLHAAASAGRTETLQQLLSIMSEFCEKNGNGSSKMARTLAPRNHMGMTPMHMACSAECMECLYMFGADIAATDEQVSIDCLVVDAFFSLVLFVCRVDRLSSLHVP
jgi:hypothetical protein